MTDLPAFGPEGIYYNDGRVAGDTEVNVYLRGTTTRPQLYRDAAGVVTAPNPIRSDAYGNLFFYVVYGNYDLEMNGHVVSVSVHNPLQDSSVTSQIITDGSIATADIANDAITTSKISNNAVTAAKIADANVTLAKLASDSVNASKIVDGSVGTSELADGSVLLAKLATDSVNAAKIVDGSVGTAELASSAVTLAKLAADSVDASKIVDGSVGVAELATDSVTAVKIAADAVGSSEIAADAVGTSELAASAVSTAKLADGSVSTIKLASDALDRVGPINLLTLNQSSMDTDVTGWDVHGLGVMTSSTGEVTAKDGTKVTKVVAVFPSHISISTGVSTPSKRTVVTPGKWYNFQIDVQAAAGTGAPELSGWSMYVYWWNAGGTQVGADVVALSGASIVVGSWKTFRAAAQAPVGAASVSFNPYKTSPANGTTVYFDAAGVWEGPGGHWAPGGSKIDLATLGRYTDESVGRRVFAWDDVNNRFQMIYGDTGWRTVLEWNSSGVFSTGSAFQSANWRVKSGVAGYVKIRRIGNVVHLSMVQIEVASALGGSDSIYTLPSGFQCTEVAWPFAKGAVASAPAHLFPLLITGGVIARGPSLSTATADLITGIQTSYTTSDAWPTSLPGIASGSVPV